jgi:hypothetical protein
MAAKMNSVLPAALRIRIYQFLISLFVRGGIKIKLEFCYIGEQLTLRGLTPK